MTKPTEVRRHGEESGDRGIGKSGDRKNGFTAEARRCGEAEDENSRPVPSCFQQARQVSGSDFSRAEQGLETWALAPAIIRSIFQTIRATLREIFDESAYDRFLLQTHASRSVASYRA